MIEKADHNEPLVVQGSRALLALRVDNTEQVAVLERLARHGGVIEASTAYTHYFRDPDGRRVAISIYPLDLRERELSDLG